MLDKKVDIKYIENLIQRDVESLGCSIWGIEVFGKNNPTLRIFVDKEKGVTINDCEKISKQILRLLEVESHLIKNFSLEVSSPGLERKFFSHDQYMNYIGYKLKVR